MSIHTGFFTPFPVLMSSICRHCENGQCLVPVIFAQLASRGKTIHDRHLDVHQNAVVLAFFDHVDRFLTMVGDIDIEQSLLQKFARNLLVDLVVLNHQQRRSLNGLQSVHLRLSSGRLQT